MDLAIQLGLAALVGIVFWVAITRWIRSVVLQRRFGHARIGERDAAALLEASGFAIEGAQVGASYPLDVDGAEVSITVRADYIVRLGSDRYVAEVKTGDIAPKLTTAATRRQLLEYQHAFAVSGLILVDADSGTLHSVRFRS